MVVLVAADMFLVRSTLLMRSGAAPHDTELIPHSVAKDSRAFEQPRFQLGVPSGHYYLGGIRRRFLGLI
jgi:hypothetical protein